MEISDRLLKQIIRHANNVVAGFEKPTAKTRDSVRLLKKDIKTTIKIIEDYEKRKD